jgi:hypothetical protein
MRGEEHDCEANPPAVLALSMRSRAPIKLLPTTPPSTVLLSDSMSVPSMARRPVSATATEACVTIATDPPLLNMVKERA